MEKAISKIIFLSWKRLITFVTNSNRMFRSHHCGELNENHSNKEVTLAGWVQKVRNKGFIIWIDLRDRYGITQLVFDEERTPETVYKKSMELGREDVIQIKGKVIDRVSKNPNIASGGIEILVWELRVLNLSLIHI